MFTSLLGSSASRLGYEQLGQLPAVQPVPPVVPPTDTAVLGGFELGTVELGGTPGVSASTRVEGTQLGTFELGLQELPGASLLPTPPVVTSTNAYVAGAVPAGLYSFVY